MNQPEDQLSAILEINAGAGGTESCDWAQMLQRMYTMWGEKNGYKVSILDLKDGEVAGVKSVSLEIDGELAYGYLNGENGVHRLVRISPFDNQSRRQTSFAAVEVLPVTAQTDHVDIPENEIRVDVFRSSGPGGQSVNTTDSAVRLTHIPTGIVVSMQNEKSQLQNREAAMRVLRARLLAAQQEALEAELSAARKSQVKSVDRSERIRTYNFPENRIADHRTGYKSYNLDQVMDGALEPVIQSAIQADEEARLAALGENE